ncbi:MAG TPA: polyhydroxyalkanoic acid system family protein [Pirellulales bacterium]|nr:polyhydroxyalkanoic acid system family protein [Pirellulales bacterium]
MPKISVSVPHQLGQQAAADRLQTLIAALKERHGSQVSDLEEEWVDDALKFRFKTFGFQFQGTGTVSDTEAKLDIDIPFAAMMFKGKIESEIRDTLTRKLR